MTRALVGLLVVALIATISWTWADATQRVEAMHGANSDLSARLLSAEQELRAERARPTPAPLLQVASPGVPPCARAVAELDYDKNNRTNNAQRAYECFVDGPVLMAGQPWRRPSSINTYVQAVLDSPLIHKRVAHIGTYAEADASVSVFYLEYLDGKPGLAAVHMLRGRVVRVD